MAGGTDGHRLQLLVPLVQHSHSVLPEERLLDVLPEVALHEQCRSSPPPATRPRAGQTMPPTDLQVAGPRRREGLGDHAHVRVVVLHLDRHVMDLGLRDVPSRGLGLSSALNLGDVRTSMLRLRSILLLLLSSSTSALVIRRSWSSWWVSTCRSLLLRCGGPAPAAAPPSVVGDGHGPPLVPLERAVGPISRMRSHKRCQVQIAQQYWYTSKPRSTHREAAIVSARLGEQGVASSSGRKRQGLTVLPTPTEAL